MNKKYYLVVTPFFPTAESFRGPFIYDQVQALKRNSNYEIVVFRPLHPMKELFYDYGMGSSLLFSPLADAIDDIKWLD